MRFNIILFMSVLLTQYINSLNILGIFPYNGKSHFLQYKVLLQALAKKGHNVTVISPFPEKNPIQNYHDISLAEETSVLMNKYKIDNSFGIQMDLMSDVFTSGNIQCEVMLSNDKVQKMVNEKTKFDVILYEQFNSDCAIGIAYKLNAPYVALNCGETPLWYYRRWGLSSNPADFRFVKTFGGRVMFPIITIVFHVYYWFMIQTNDQKLIAKYIGEVPDLEELAKQTKLSLVYQNFVLGGTRTLPQNIIEIGGYHVLQAKPLQGKLKKFVEEAEHGVIYISFGSIIKSSSMSPEKLKVMLEIMEEFPQRFVWKWEAKTLAADKNKLYIDDWLPQVDILGHPNTVAFVTHAGLGSANEGLHYGVPMLAIPITAEQPFNAEDIERSGLGTQLNYDDLNKENLRAALKKILDPEFRNQVKRVSATWHDRPMKALDTAIYWTEFVARHPDLNMRLVTADVPLYQAFYIEPLAVFILIIFIFWSVFRFCCKIMFSKKTAKKKSE